MKKINGELIVMLVVKKYHKKNIIKKCSFCNDDFDVDEKYKNNIFCKPCYYKNRIKY